MKSYLEEIRVNNLAYFKGEVNGWGLGKYTPRKLQNQAGLSVSCFLNCDLVDNFLRYGFYVRSV